MIDGRYTKPRDASHSHHVQKPLLGCDIDGVLYDFDSAARAILRQYGHNIPAVESAHWNGLEDEVGFDAWARMWSHSASRRELFRGGPAYISGVKTCRRLQQIVDLVIITHRPLDVADITMRWLANQKITPRALHFAGGRDKGAVEQRCIGYVEDRADNAREIAETTGCPVFVPRRPWNVGLDDDGLITYFDDWRVVEKWAKETVGGLR